MKKIPWWQPIIGKEEEKLVTKVFKNNFPNEGKFTEEFENELSKLLKIKHVIAVNNATSAMFLSLKAIGIGPGDEVIVPDITFIATANAVEMTGARAILADIESKTLGLDPGEIEKKISKRTKAIIPVHVSGRASDLSKILIIAKKHKLFVVEDAAEAFMSMHNEKYLGTFGITGCFSLSPAKTITTGQGGFISTNDESIYKILKRLKDQGRPVRGTGGDDIHESLGFNFKFTDLQAAVGLGQLSYLETRTKILKKNYELYEKYLEKNEHFSLYKFNSEEVPQWIDGNFEDRDYLVKYLSKNNVDSRNFWFPIHTQKYYKDSDKNFPVSTKISKSSLWLPSAFTLKENDIKKVSSLINSFYEKR